MKRFLTILMLLWAGALPAAVGPGAGTNRLYGTYVTAANNDYVEVSADRAGAVGRLYSGSMGATTIKPLILGAGPIYNSIVIATNGYVRVSDWMIVSNGLWITASNTLPSRPGELAFWSSIYGANRGTFMGNDGTTTNLFVAINANDPPGAPGEVPTWNAGGYFDMQPGGGVGGAGDGTNLPTFFIMATIKITNTPVEGDWLSFSNATDPLALAIRIWTNSSYPMTEIISLTGVGDIATAYEALMTNLLDWERFDGHGNYLFHAGNGADSIYIYGNPGELIRVTNNGWAEITYTNNTAFAGTNIFIGTNNGRLEFKTLYAGNNIKLVGHSNVVVISVRADGDYDGGIQYEYNGVLKSSPFVIVDQTVKALYFPTLNANGIVYLTDQQDMTNAPNITIDGSNVFVGGAIYATNGIYGDGSNLTNVPGTVTGGAPDTLAIWHDATTLSNLSTVSHQEAGYLNGTTSSVICAVNSYSNGSAGYYSLVSGKTNNTVHIRKLAGSGNIVLSTPTDDSVVIDGSGLLPIVGGAAYDLLITSVDPTNYAILTLGGAAGYYPHTNFLFHMSDSTGIDYIYAYSSNMVLQTITNVNIGGSLHITNGAFAYSDSASNAPAANEYPTAQWVRNLISGSGYYYYATTNLIAGFANTNGTTNIYAYSTDIPAPGQLSHSNVVSSQYVGATSTTNRFTYVSGPVVVNAYMGIETTAGKSLTIHPEIYFSYDGTNWFGDYECANQSVTTGSNLYQFVVTFPAYSASNQGVYVERRFKIGTAVGAPDVTFYVGTNTPSFISFSGPNSGGGYAYLANDQTFTGSNIFNQSIVLPIASSAIQMTGGNASNYVGYSTFARYIPYVSGVAHLMSPGNMTLAIDSDNNETDRLLAFQKNSNTGSGTELMRLTEDGYLQVNGWIQASNSFGALSIGYEAGARATTAYNTVIIGDYAGVDSTNSYESVFIGEGCASNSAGSKYSVVVGYWAAANTTNGDFNAVIGMNAGRDAAESTYSVMMGHVAGFHSYGSTEDVFLGASAGWGMTNTTRSVFVGRESGYLSDSNKYMTVVGYNAGYTAPYTTNSVFIGNTAGREAQMADNSVFIGAFAGTNAILSSNSVFIGYQAGGAVTNANRLIIDTLGLGTNGLIYGEFDTPMLRINGSLQVTGSLIFPMAINLTNINLYDATNNGVFTVLGAGEGAVDIFSSDATNYTRITIAPSDRHTTLTNYLPTSGGVLALSNATVPVNLGVASNMIVTNMTIGNAMIYGGSNISVAMDNVALFNSPTNAALMIDGTNYVIDMNKMYQTIVMTNHLSITGISNASTGRIKTTVLFLHVPIETNYVLDTPSVWWTADGEHSYWVSNGWKGVLTIVTEENIATNAVYRPLGQ